MIHPPIMPKPPPPNFLTTSEAARRLKCSEATVRRMEGRGELVATKTARGMRLFAIEDIETALKNR